MSIFNGFPGALNDKMFKFFKDQGLDGSLDDMFKQYLENEGYTGSYTRMLKQFNDLDSLSETIINFADSMVSIQITGNQPTREGLFGVQYVQMPAEGLSLDSITPLPVSVEGDTTSGAMLNPQRNSGTDPDQSFDQRISSYIDLGNVQGDVISFAPNDILVKAVSNFTVDVDTSSDRRAGIIDSFSILYGVTSLPDAEAIPPSPIGWSGRSSLTWDNVDWDAKVAVLPEYSVPDGTTPVTYSQLSPYFKLNPIPALMDATIDTVGYETMSPRNWGGNFATNANYGRYPGILYNENMGLFLTLPAANASAAQKREVLQFLATQGRWWYEAMKNSGISKEADGGHYRFQTICIETYLWVTDQTAVMDTLAADATTNQYHQYYKLTSGQKTLFETPHNEFAKTLVSRQRNITNVSGTTLRINAASNLTETDSDDVRGRFTGYELVRVSDGVSARITDTTDVTDDTGSYEIIIDSQPSPTFAVNDVVYLRPEAEALEVGTYHYTVKSSEGDFFRLSGMVPEDEYRGFAKDGALAFYRRALGYYRAVHEPLEGYVVQTWDGDFPPLYPWPDPFEILTPITGASVWAESFIREHAPSVIPALAPPAAVSTFIDNYFDEVFGTAASFDLDIPAGKYLFTVEAIANGGVGEAPTELNIAGQTVAPFVSGNTSTQSYTRPVVAMFEVTLGSAFNGSATLDIGNRRYNNLSVRSIDGLDVITAESGTTFTESVAVDVLAGDTLVLGTAARNNNPTYGSPITTNYTDDSASGSRAFGGGQGVFDSAASPTDVGVTGIGVSNGRITAYTVLRPTS